VGIIIVGLQRHQVHDVDYARARELASEGRHPQMIELLLEMEGYSEAYEVIPLDFASELKRIVDQARKERNGSRP
jgi:hypothetical protein